MSEPQHKGTDKIGLSQGEECHWWQTNRFIAFAALIFCVPLLWPQIPPLVDLPSHMGLYRIETSLNQYPWLQNWYGFKWVLCGNMGVDLLVVPLNRILGLEPAVKLIVLAIPALTVTGLLWTAKEAHGRIPLTALFALPFAYGLPFQLGFVNYCLSMALALNAFALWLRLTRLERIGLRALIFAPVSIIIWIAQAFGWFAFCVLVFSAELMRQHERRASWPVAVFRAGIQCLPIGLPPALLTLFLRGKQAGGIISGWPSWKWKFLFAANSLDDHCRWFDYASVGVIILLLLILLICACRRRVAFSPALLLAGVILAILYLFAPVEIWGASLVDLRIAPWMLAILVLAFRPGEWRPSPGLMTLLVIMAASFVLLRVGGNTISLYLFDRAFQRELVALNHLPQRARLVTFIDNGGPMVGIDSRLQHLPGLALERNLAFSNEQTPESHSITVKFNEAGSFGRDPSQRTTARHISGMHLLSISEALTSFPRDAFDYVWLVRPPPYKPELEKGLIPLWRNGTSALFRVDHSAQVK